MRAVHLSCTDAVLQAFFDLYQSSKDSDEIGNKFLSTVAGLSTYSLHGPIMLFQSRPCITAAEIGMLQENVRMQTQQAV